MVKNDKAVKVTPNEDLSKDSDSGLLPIEALSRVI